MKRVLARGTVIDGNLMAASLLDKLKAVVAAGPAKIPPPRMAILLAGSNLATESYVRKKLETASRVSIDPVLIRFGSMEMSKMLQQINELNRDDSCHGYLVQLPLPEEYDQRKVLDAVSTTKDIDCLHTDNLKMVEALGENANILPCTSQAVLHTCDEYGIDVRGKRTVVVGRSLLVGQPTAMLLAARGALVQTFDRYSK